MSEGADANVQVALDGAGKRVHHLKITKRLDDGTLEDVYVAGVVALDVDGYPIDTEQQIRLLQEIRDELKILTRAVIRVTGGALLDQNRHGL